PVTGTQHKCTTAGGTNKRNRLLCNGGRVVRRSGPRHALWYVEQRVVLEIKRAGKNARFDLAQPHARTEVFEAVIDSQRGRSKQPGATVLLDGTGKRFSDIQWRAVPHPADGAARFDPADGIGVNGADLCQRVAQFTGTPP